ncbi:MAG: tRNA (adenosine(37)-N6)-threonylcarbamoyltransferase complex transferase subunit TsaD [Opitutaceae bacterium]|nr:tRNA (adenosine(37)-N6)-threonylcarbamoyltransferase complex transferase subunit TsaD [Cytophagales bacterium]
MYSSPCTILAIESSCDDTSAAIIKDGIMLSNIVATQEIHRKYGGVVPELASRAHQQNIVPVVLAALENANIVKNDLKAVAYTQGPGLLGSLLVGCSFAKSLSLALSIPLIAVDHMQAHVLAHFIEDPKPVFPFLCLTVSGGHTQIVLVESALRMKVIGRTIDDAVGEAFDKSAKMLNLPYPGGPLVDKLAQTGNPLAYKFSKTQVEGLNFSFSGIKTSILYFLKANIAIDPDFIQKNLADICASIQSALINMLVEKLIKAVDQTGIKQVAIAGGVSANSGLRTRMQSLAFEKGLEVFIPKLEYCTDNAGMIAMAAHFKFQEGIFEDLNSGPNPRLNSFV